MRKSVKLIAALLIVISAAPVAFSNDSTTSEETKLKVWSTAEGLYRMLYKDSGQQNLQIRFVDAQDQVLYSERVFTKDGFLKPFDLTQLPAGSYTFEVETQDGVYTESITIETASQKYADFVTISSSAASQVKVDLDQEIDTELSLYLIGEDGELIYKEQEAAGSKVYDLSQVPSQEVTVLVYADQELVKSSIVKL